MYKIGTLFLLLCLFELNISFRESSVKKEDHLFKTPELATKHVIVLVIDGPRYSETFGDSTYQYIPNLGKKLRHDGVLFTHFRNNGSTYTNAGHTAITTGYYQSISNGGKELPKRPSIFQYYLKSSGADKSKAWIVSSKGKLEILANTKNKKWWNMYMPYTYCGPAGNSSAYVGDKLTFEKIKSVIANHTPNLMLINLLEVDVNGHGNDWEGYKKALKNCDQYVADLWTLIQENPEMKGQTTLFITNDHGRHLDGHKDGFISHGDRCEGCRQISLLALGPDFVKNKVVSTSAEQLDISKTISYLLDFEMPTSEGRILKELFEN